MTGSPFAYVRDSYGVPAHRGARVWYRGTPGRIVHATNYVYVKFAAEDMRANSMLACYVPRDEPPSHITVVLHPCEDHLAYDRETPLRHRPTGFGYFVWSELCFGFGIAHRSPLSQHPALREPWPRDPREQIGAAA
ncbi:MAG: hypothetical protein ABSD03_12360 [Vulcanimicrobiaceae bacterium]